MKAPIAHCAPGAVPGSRAKRMRVIAIVLLVVAAATATGIAVHADGSRSVAGQAADLVSLTVTAATARPAQWPRTLDAVGKIAPWQEAIIGAQTTGLSLARVEVAVGDVVKRGQLLARFDTSTLRAEEAQLQALLTQAQGTAAQADANRTRALQLKGSGSISEQEVQRYVTEAITAQAQVASARAQLDAKRLQLRQADVVAPDDGVISARVATLGAVVNTGQELFRIVRQGRLEWRGEFSPAQIASIAAGQRVALKLPDGSVASARVRQIAPLLNERSRLGLVYADIAPGSRARGGMYVEGSIALPETSALVVPASSVVIRDGRSIVFRLSGDDAQAQVQTEFVVVGRRRGADVEILDPLAAGDRIVAHGAGLLSDGEVVRVERTALPTSDAEASPASGGTR